MRLGNPRREQGQAGAISSVDDGKLLVSIRTIFKRENGQLRVGCIEQGGDTSPREMIAQVMQIIGQNAAYRPA